MRCLNRVELIGRLGRDPECRSTQDGARVANLSIATDEVFKNAEGLKETRTEWHRVVVWKGLADVAEKYLRKGDAVFIAGQLRTRKWTDAEGVDRWQTEIVLSGPRAELSMLSSKPADDEEGREAA